MNQPEHFQIEEGHAVFRPTGELSLEQGVQLVTSAIVIVFAREQHIRKLLVDTTVVTGFDPPSLAARYFFAQDWACAAQGRFALQSSPDQR